MSKMYLGFNGFRAVRDHANRPRRSRHKPQQIKGRNAHPLEHTIRGRSAPKGVMSSRSYCFTESMYKGSAGYGFRQSISRKKPSRELRLLGHAEVLGAVSPFQYSVYTIPSAIACCHQAHLSFAMSSVLATKSSVVIRTTPAFCPWTENSDSLPPSPRSASYPTEW